VNPAPLVGNEGRFAGSYFPLSLVNPGFGIPDPIEGVSTPFALYRDLFRGQCVLRNGLSFMEITTEPGTGEVRKLPKYRNATVESIGFGMHLVDYNLALEDLIKLVQRQAAAMK
jgi:hypothetical protein